MRYLNDVRIIILHNWLQSEGQYKFVRKMLDDQPIFVGANNINHEEKYLKDGRHSSYTEDGINKLKNK